jgi:hypothetical protein
MASVSIRLSWKVSPLVLCKAEAPLPWMVGPTTFGFVGGLAMTHRNCYEPPRPE